MNQNLTEICSSRQRTAYRQILITNLDPLVTIIAAFIPKEEPHAI